MKKTLYFFILLLISVSFIASCERGDTPDGARVRITKIADNQAMEDPWYVFEYNSEGLLTTIIGYSNYSMEIDYNSNGLPIKLNDYTIISWTDDGFILSNDENDNKEIYVLEANGRIIKKTEIFTPQFSDPDTSVINAIWTGDENLSVPEYSSTYKYVKKNNPFSGINLATVVAAELEYGEWEIEFQNNYCIIEYDEGIFSAEVTYQFNSQNYPTVADIKYTSEEGVFHDYVYFEYELY